MDVGLGPGHIVLDGDPAPPKKQEGTAPPILANALWPNGHMDQDATRYGGMPLPWPHCVRWGPPKDTASNFQPMSVVTKRLDQGATWYAGRPRPRRHCVRWGLSFPERGTAPNFRPMSVVAKRLNGSRYHLVRR